MYRETFYLKKVQGSFWCHVRYSGCEKDKNKSIGTAGYQSMGHSPQKTWRHLHDVKEYSVRGLAGSGFSHT